MMNVEFITKYPYVFAALALWELLWKGPALWKTAKKNQKYWFVAILIINSLGILPIIYLLLNKKPAKQE